MEVLLFCLGAAGLAAFWKVTAVITRLERVVAALPSPDPTAHQDAPVRRDSAPVDPNRVEVVKASTLKRFDSRCGLCGSMSMQEHACMGCEGDLMIKGGQRRARVEGAHIHSRCIMCKAPAVRAALGES